MHIKKSQWPIVLVTILYLLFFTIYFFYKKNYEFILYIIVVLFFAFLIILSNKKIKYTNRLLWLLTIWAFFHMAGGCLYLNGIRLYELILIPISETYNLFRYDQLIHIYGFMVATFVSYHLIKPLLRPRINKWFALSIVVAMAGLGFGALNEIIEFFATQILTTTGVGDYINTSLDLISNLVGAIIAVVIIRIKEK